MPAAAFALGAGWLRRAGRDTALNLMEGLAALFLAHWVTTGSAAEALGRAAASVHGLLRRTADAGSREILLVAAQEEFVAPSRSFDVEEV